MATWAATAPASAVPRKYQGSFGAAGTNGYSVVSPEEHRAVRVAVLTATGNYTAGGDAFSPAAIGLNEITRVYLIADDATANTPAASGGLTPAVDLTDGTAPKMKLYSSANTETSGSITGKAFLLRFEGR